MNHRPATSSVLVAVCAAFCATGFGAEVAAAQHQAVSPDALVGTWRLVEHWDRDSSGALTQQFGPHPVGYFLHDATGHFSVQIMRTPPMRSIAVGPDSVALASLRELFDGYYGAFGTYSVDAARAESVYHIVGSTRPNLIGIDADLPFRVVGDSLIIGDDETWRRVWIRVR